LDDVVSGDARFGILNDVPVGVFVLRRDFSVLFWNRCLEDWTGIPRSKILGTHIGKLFPHLTQSKYQDRLQLIFEGGPPIIFSSQLHKFLIPSPRRNGQMGIQHTTVTPIQVGTSGDYLALFSIQDVTDLTHRIQEYRLMQDQALEEIKERRRVEDELRKRERQQAATSEIGAFCLKTSDLQEVMNKSVEIIANTLGVDLCKILLLNESGDALTLAAGVGWREGTVGKATVPTGPNSQAGYTLMIKAPVIVENLQTEMRFHGPPLLFEHEVVAGMSVPMISRQWTIGVLGAHSREQREFSPDDVAFLQNASNLISVAIDRKHAEESLAQRSIRDALTNLYNRRHFHDRLVEEVSRAGRNRQPFAVLLCDLDGFKLVNDTRGHQIGDEVLKRASRSIQESTRGSDLIFRWGGDEFVVVLSNADRTGILIAADRIRKAIQKIGGEFGLDLDLSIGVALYPEHGTNEDELIRLADRALYIAKKGGYRVYIGTEEYEINEHSVQAVFQPVMDVLSNERLGFEALCRDPEGKLSVPEFFKKYNAIGQLSQLKRICFLSQLRIAEEMGLKRVFLNIDFDLLSRVTPVPKSAMMEVVLEISELEALKDLEKWLAIAAKWRSAGYQFAIDDFGAGFVSLPFIARLIPEYIKIDRSTILQAVSSRPFGGFLKSLLQALSSYVTKGIIAEGVEREEELQVVKDIGIFMVQGYLFGRPEALQ